MRGDGSTPAHFLTITVRPGPQRCRYREQVLGIIRLRLDHGAADDESVQTSMQELVGILQQQPGVIRVALGRADEPSVFQTVTIGDRADTLGT
jgi:hypothetical protein